MKKYNEKYLKEGFKVFGEPKFDGPGILLYEYIRGSKAYGLDTPHSDEDRGGIYIAPNKVLLSMPQRKTPMNYQEQVTSEFHDDSWFEVSRFFELLAESNPNVLESLFIDDRFIIYEDPVITDLKKRREEFVTKSSFDKFGGYAVSQVRKARGLNKKIVKPVLEKKSPIDFVYTFYNQGSTPITSWLAYRGLKQEFCGLVAVPNMHNTYGLYYDWSSHIDSVKGLRSILNKGLKLRNDNVYQFKGNEINIFVEFEETYAKVYPDDPLNKYSLKELLESESKHYKGIVKDNSLDLCLSSVPEKNIMPVTHIVYNQEGYSQHARDYTSYKKWEQERNPERYSLNKGMNYDRKNMMHSFRLVRMAIEIARDEGVKVFRDKDRDFLLGIRNTKYTYEELLEELNKLIEEMNTAFETSILPESIDKEKVNEILLKIRYEKGEF